MGYESKLIIAEAGISSDRDGCWLDEIATVDLCKMGYDTNWSQLLKASKAERTDNRRFYFYSGGDGRTYEDLYGDPLLPLDLGHAIKAIEADDTDGYRRLPPALAVLRSFQETQHQWRDLVVLHFGH
jgi:hypothetical protein